MNNNLTELVFILDRSGSMSGLEQDTIGGYNSLIEKQKAAEGRAVITTVLFDDQYEVLHDRMDLDFLGPLTSDDYYVRGMTALLDAIGRTIQTTISHRRKMPKEKQPAKTIFVITTDGAENASYEYSAKRIKQMIEHQTNKYGWEFLFLGANIDAVQTAADIGIGRDRAAQYHADKKGVRSNFEALESAISHMRTSDHRMDDSWKETIEADYHSRKKNN